MRLDTVIDEETGNIEVNVYMEVQLTLRELSGASAL